MTTTEQRARIDEARNEIERHIRQMASDGRHDVACIKQALIEILEVMT